MDSTIIPTILRADKPSVLCDSTSNSLLSASLFTREKNAVETISEKDDLGVELDGTVNSLLNDIKNHSFKEKIF